MIIYDVTARETFENVNLWLNQLMMHCTMEEPPVIIVGNKCDIQSKKAAVNKEDITHF